VVKNWGSHKFGFGATFAPIRWSVLPNKVNAVGQLRPETLDAFYQGGVDSKSPTADFTVLTKSFTSQPSIPISFFQFGIYGEDEWHARPNLTLTLALRAEHYSNPTCENCCFSRLTGPFESISHDPSQPYDQVILVNQKHALQNTDSILWSPRFSFAWQPFGVSHSSVLRGGVGLFYDPLPDGIMESFYINSPNYNVFTPFDDNLTPNEKTSLFKDAAIQLGGDPGRARQNRICPRV
jgi:outer membrane receptor protein involved in Fe transport